MNIKSKREQDLSSRSEIKISIFNSIRKDIKTAKQLIDKEIEITKLRRVYEFNKKNHYYNNNNPDLTTNNNINNSNSNLPIIQTLPNIQNKNINNNKKSVKISNVLFLLN